MGGVVEATDPDPNAETPMYSLSGDDAMHFRVRDNGQIEVGASAKLDYEATKNTYMVTLTATDSFGASSSIMVTIMVKDVDEDPAGNHGRRRHHHVRRERDWRGGDVHGGGPGGRPC